MSASTRGLCGGAAEVLSRCASAEPADAHPIYGRPWQSASGFLLSRRLEIVHGPLVLAVFREPLLDLGIVMLQEALPSVGGGLVVLGEPRDRALQHVTEEMPR